MNCPYCFSFMKKIPFLDLYQQYSNHKDEIDDAVKRCVQDSSFIYGPEHDAFAEEFSQFCGGGHTALCGNGTDALTLTIVALLGKGEGKGEIITVANTFVATVEAIVHAGYRPVFIEVDPKTCLMDLSQIEDKINENTKAIIPVHLYGQMVAMDDLARIAKDHRIAIIEDAAQAHGALWKGHGPGYYSDAACFSFHPAKNLSTWGDGGAVFTKDKALAERIRMLGNHGQRMKQEHVFCGYNSRMGGIQAAVLRVKLKYLKEKNEKRRQAAQYYHQLLVGAPDIQKPFEMDSAYHVYQLYVIQIDQRDQVKEALSTQGINAGIHYPRAVYEQAGFDFLNVGKEELPITTQVCRRVISLPLYPEITKEQVQSVVAKTVSAVSKSLLPTHSIHK